MLLTRDEAAKRLRVHVGTVDRRIRAGLIRAIKAPGTQGSIRISEEAIADYIKQQTLVVDSESEAS